MLLFERVEEFSLKDLLSELLEKSKRKSLKGKRFEFQALNYEFVNGDLYVKKVNNYDTLLIGSQVLKVNDEPVGKILGKYKKTIASDGYNTTFYNRFMAQHFGKLYNQENQQNRAVLSHLIIFL